MRFQPGQSGNPAGRPPGSLNKKTLAAQALLDERAEEMVTNLMDRSKNGEPAAMRLVSDRLLPTGRNRLVVIELPVIKTPEDAELALTVVTDELAAGKLTIAEASALITLIDRMLRLAERMWKFEQARREAADADQEAPQAPVQAPRSAEKPGAPLYSPVNSKAAAGADANGAPGKGDGKQTPSNTAGHDAAPPLQRAA
jgi:uncharacterized protein DUF5681